MFEVGKKYQNKHSLSVWDCLWNDGKFVLLRCGLGSPGVWQQGHFTEFREYREHVIEKYTRTVCRGKYGVWTNGENAVGPHQVGKCEYTITDGKLTKVEIL